MRVLVKVVLASLLLNGFLFGGQKIFDLSQQVFSETLKEKDLKNGSYDLPFVVVDTNAKYYVDSKVYSIRGKKSEEAFFKITPKTPLKNWVYQDTKKIYNNSYRDRYRPNQIIATSTNGSSIVISTKGVNTSINDKELEINFRDDEQFVYSIEKMEDRIKVKINGSVVYDVKSKDFGELDNIKTSVSNIHNGSEDIKSIELYSR